VDKCDRSSRRDEFCAAYVADGSDCAGRGGLLHAGGDVHRDAADGAFGIHAAAQQHAAGVDAHADVEAGVLVGRKHFGAEHFAHFQQGHAAVHGAFGVDFARIIRTEGGLDVAAGLLQHLAAVGLHDGRAARQGVVHHRADGFRVQLLAERGRTHHV
jgi:hypothetical protein